MRSTGRRRSSARTSGLPASLHDPKPGSARPGSASTTGSPVAHRLLPSAKPPINVATAAVDAWSEEVPLHPGRGVRSVLAVASARSAVTTVLDRLEKRRYVRRLPNPEDRRQIVVALTPFLCRRASQIYDDGGEVGALLARPYGPVGVRPDG